MAEVYVDIIARDSFSGVLGNFGSIMTGIESVINMAGRAFQEFTDIATEAFDAIAFYERLTITAETMLAVEQLMAGSANNMTEALAMTSGQAEILLDWMQDLAIHSPFTLEGVANAFSMAQAYGFTAEQAQRLIQAETDYVAGSGRTEYAMTAITRALGQISATGKLMGQDMLQLTQVGVPVAQILADAFGKTTAEIYEMRRAGLLPAQETIEAITVWMETNFVGAADRLTTSFAGLKGTFQDLKAMALREFFGEMYDNLKPLLVELSNWLQGPGIETIKALGGVLGELVGTIFEKYEGFTESPFMKWLDALIEKSSILVPNFSELNTNFGGMQEGTGEITYDPLIDTELFIVNLKEAIKEAIKESFEEAVLETDWGEVTDELAKGIDAIDWALLGEHFGAGIKEVLGIGGQKLGEVDWVNLIFQPIKAAGEFLAGWFSSFWGVEVSGSFEEAIQQWKNFGTGLGNWMKEFWTNLAGDVGNWFIETGDKIGNWASNLGPNIMEGINGLEESMTEWLKDFSVQVISGLQDYAVEVINSLNEVPGKIYDKAVEIGSEIGHGVVDGLSSIGHWALDPFIEFLKDVKAFFGISSPSAVFFNIGRDIVLGLINGLNSMLGSLLNIARNMAEKLLEPLAPVLGLLGIDLGGGTHGTSSTINWGGGTSTEGTATLGGTVTNNYYFYGTVYMSGVGPEGTYDCPPSPIITGSAGTLHAPGFSP